MLVLIIVHLEKHWENVALKLDQSIMYVEELNKNEPGKSRNNSWPT